MEVRHGARRSEPHRPQVMRVRPRGRKRSVDRGVSRRGIERRKPIRGADVLRPAEGNTAGVAIARRLPTPRRRRPWHAHKPSAREPGDLHRRPRQPWPGPLSGRPEAVADNERVEKSDPPEVAKKQANKAASAAAEPVERRAGPRRMRGCKARSGRRAGKPCHRRRPAYEKPSPGTKGQADGAPAPRQH